MEIPTPAQIARFTADELDQFLELLRGLGSTLKAAEIRTLREVDRRQIPLGDGMRTLEEWIVGRMDVAPETARKLASVARSDSAELDEMLAEQTVSFDRIAELARAGETDPHHELDLVGLRRLLSRRQELTRNEEQDAFERRHLAIQPSLDDSAWKLWGELPALEGKIVADTLDRVADELPDPPVGHRESRATRRADALFVVCDRDGSATPSPLPPAAGAPNPPATVIVDATDGPIHPNAWVVSGPRIGPNTLERILCGSPIDVIARTADGTPLAVGSASTAIPPKTRRYVIARDGGMCTADGCGSSYRLQPHHIRERKDGGDHHHENVTSLCWYHHHVVIHGRGFRIDPTSPTRRRRFLEPCRSGSDPPI